MNDFINYYELLGVRNDASKEVIKNAYKLQIKKWHPDRNKSSEAIEVTKKLNIAREVLLDDDKRREYDLFLKNYTDDSYQNMKERVYKEESKDSKYNNTYKESCTKWEYFYDYLRYYNVSILRKVIAVILVILESVLVFILQVVNFLVALLLSLVSGGLKYIANLVLGLLIMAVIIGLITSGVEIMPNSFKDWLEVIAVIFLWFMCTIMPQVLIDLMIDKMPRLLANLNIFLFKKCVGYKEYDL